MRGLELFDQCGAVHNRVITRHRDRFQAATLPPTPSRDYWNETANLRVDGLYNLEAGFCTNAMVQQLQKEAMKTPDPQLRQELLNTKYKPYEDAFNQNDAAAVAALYTEDAVLLPPETDSVYGREAIEKYFADLFTQYHASNCVIRPDEYSPHIIGTGGDGLWSSGNWSATFKAKTGDSIQLKSKWSSIYVREGNAWQIQMDIWNITPEPAPTA